MRKSSGKRRTDSKGALSAWRASGVGFNVALSVAFYLIVLAVGIGYDHSHRLRSPQSNPPAGSSADWLASVRPPPFPLMSFEAIGPIRVLLAQAHDCALAGRWDCMNSATHAAIALRNDSSETQPESQPETQTLLAQANANETWVSSRATVAGRAYIDRSERLKVAAHVRAPYDRWRHYRHSGRASVRPASPEFLAGLYRH
ncbi:MAG TPA: hypothetical protein VJS30_09515 [Paraburkholderia sp.]|nr:hypothetical protein [Paraburkholderia sp.]